MIKDYFNQLPEREQKLLLVGGLVAVIVIVYGLIWQPMSDSIAKNEQAIANQQELLVWVQQSGAKLQQLKAGSNTKTFRGNITQVVNNSARQFNIVISRMQPNSKEVQVWIDEVEFNAWVKWIDFLSKQGIAVDAADLAKGDRLGTVKVRRLQLSS